MKRAKTEKLILSLLNDCSLLLGPTYSDLFPGIYDDTFLLKMTSHYTLYRVGYSEPTRVSPRQLLSILCPDDLAHAKVKSFEDVYTQLNRSTKYHYEGHMFPRAPQRPGLALIARFDRAKWDYFPRTLAKTAIYNEPNLPEYLFTAIKWLCFEDKRTNPIKDGSYFLTSSVLLQNACQWLLSDWFGSIGGTKSILTLHEICDAMSLMGYETRPPTGGFLLTPDRLAVPGELSFKRDVPIEDHRSLRKLLEICANGRVLVSDGEYVYGAIDRERSQALVDKELIYFEITGRHRWRVRPWKKKGILGSPVYEVRDGRISLRPPKISAEDFQADIRSTFSGASQSQARKLWRIVSELVDARHGALLTIDSHAGSEADRLRQQAIPIEPQCLKIGALRGLIEVDGALLFDLDACCHAFGVILDGQASATEGDPSRGARYNSAVRYVSARSGLALAVCISEDGYVDVIKPSV